jgi:hypothetical protein
MDCEDARSPLEPNEYDVGRRPNTEVLADDD